MAVVLLSCEDDRIYNPATGEGEATVTAEITYKVLTPALSRATTGGTTGNAISSINTLAVVLIPESDVDGTAPKYILHFFDRSQLTIANEGGTPADGGYSDPNHQAEETTERATAKLEKVPYGNYRIFAIANVPKATIDGALALDNGSTPAENLKNIQLEWSENVPLNNQMFGFFSAAGNVYGDVPVLIINRPTPTIKAWVRRAVSKVTVSFDGSDLKEGVEIYIKSVTIKQIPNYCLLGNPNTVENSEDLLTGQTVTYAQDEPFDSSYPALIDSANCFFPRKTATGADDKPEWTAAENPHLYDSAHSLFFFENMQGTGMSKVQEKDKDGNLVPYDPALSTDAKPCGTYIEVEAYYESTNPERPGISDISYRFMLGKNITTDYNAERNYHYKLILHFNGFADDPDWRIDHVKRFSVSHPKKVNYQGKFFVPDFQYANEGNTFSDQNIIRVESYIHESGSYENREPVDFTWAYVGGAKPAWLEDIVPYTDEETEKDPCIKKYLIKYDIPYTEVELNNLLQNATEKTGTYDLSGGLQNTANCYIVDCGGTYTLPLVYGNAVQSGNEVTTTYATIPAQNTLAGEDHSIETLRNYRNEPIKSGYILTDVGLQPTAALSASIVWEDANPLVEEVQYLSTLYDNQGGIQFKVKKSANLKQGNAVIAIKDPDGTIMWSWHIWVTSMDYGRSAVLTNFDGEENSIMPVNLGWCSNGEPIRYYDSHECEVVFTQKGSNGEAGFTQTVKIIQEPHIATPKGNNTYFQWGRKDPFVGTNKGYENKVWWYQDGAEMKAADWTAGQWPYVAAYQPPFLNIPFAYGGPNPNDRKPSTEQLGEMIQNPNRLNNPRRSGFVPEIKDENGNVTQAGKEGDINDEIYSNLWNNTTKTIYDPCPVGYKVSAIPVFTGFVTGHTDTDEHSFAVPTTEIDKYGYSVVEENMLKTDNMEYVNGVMEFYTSKEKLISVSFPLTGYRDYDAGLVYYVWSNPPTDILSLDDWTVAHYEGHTYIWESQNFNNNNSSFVKTYPIKNWYKSWGVSKTGYIGVGTWVAFYATDACSIRPVKE